MRTLVHLSDLRFGQLTPSLIEPLTARLHGFLPTIVTIAGDLTASANLVELRAARAFVDSLPGARIVVPGRRDVPRLAILERIKGPYERFRREVEVKTAPFYSDNLITIPGLPPVTGRVEDGELSLIRQTFAAATPGACRVLVSQSPFGLPTDLEARPGVALPTAQEQLLGNRVDLFLAGVPPRRRAPSSGATFYLEPDPAAPGEMFHVVHLQGSELLIERYAWDSAVSDYRLARSTRFRKTETRWEAS